LSIYIELFLRLDGIIRALYLSKDIYNESDKVFMLVTEPIVQVYDKMCRTRLNNYEFANCEQHLADLVNGRASKEGWLLRVFDLDGFLLFTMVIVVFILKLMKVDGFDLFQTL
jgi:hypothetical protein